MNNQYIILFVVLAVLLLLTSCNVQTTEPISQEDKVYAGWDAYVADCKLFEVSGVINGTEHSTELIYPELHNFCDKTNILDRTCYVKSIKYTYEINCIKR
jgi:hypothetical protein